MRCLAKKEQVWHVAGVPALGLEVASRRANGTTAVAPYHGKPLKKYVLPLRSADDVGSRLSCTWPVTLLAFPNRDVIDVA